MTLEEAERLHEARQYRRRRLIRGIRGYFYTERRIRSVFALLCLFSVVSSAGASALLRACGLQPMLARWPVSLVLGAAAGLCVARWWVEQAYRRFAEAGEVQRFVDTDEREEAQAFADDERLDEQISEGFRHGYNAGNQQGAGGCIMMIAWPILWLIWQTGRDLRRIGPTLLAELFIDGPLAARFPELEKRMPVQKWYVAAAEFAAPRVAVLGIVSAVVAIILAIVAPGATTLTEAFAKIQADAQMRATARESPRL